jgi:hypothetical protein
VRCWFVTAERRAGESDRAWNSGCGAEGRAVV